MIKAFALLVLLIPGCSFGPANLQSRFASDLDARKIKRIAVLPPAQRSSAQKGNRPLGSTSTPEVKTAASDAPELVLAQSLYSTMVSMPNWQIVSESEVREVSQDLAPNNDVARFKRVGEMVYADAVLTSRILRYRERIGDEWGAKSPASVAFVVELVDVRRGDVVWSARFDETQKPLSENIFAIGDISQRGVKWLTAEQLTREGARKAVAELYQTLIRNSAS